MATPLKFLLYELAVTNAPWLPPFFRAVHGGYPATMREDFSGTAAVARAWVDLNRAHRAVAVDYDPRVTRHIPRKPRLRVVTGDVLRSRVQADIITATNFPICYWHTRAALLKYLRHAHACLNHQGVLVCDIYGGEGCWTPRTQRVRVKADRPGVPRAFTYEWEQVAADPRTGLVHNAIHFSWKEKGRTRRIDNAFTYHWRLWSIPELSDAMREAGFASVDVYTRLADAIDHEGNVHVEPAREVDATYVVYLAARK